MDLWRIIQGEIPIILVASHNQNHVRGGNLKLADIGTGDIVEDLCQKTGCWGIMSIEVQDDPNWYVQSPFREKVKKLILDNNLSFVCDIHGRKASAEYLTEYFPNHTFQKDSKVLLNGKQISHFKDNDQLTLVEDLDSLNIAGVEVEIRKDGRERRGEQSAYEIVQKEIACLIDMFVK